jgi:hypothetical protein
MMFNTVNSNFWLENQTKQFALRRLYHVPRKGEHCFFNDKIYEVTLIEWCLDDDATLVGTRVNVVLKPIPTYAEGKNP